jgi:hypothetical protein
MRVLGDGGALVVKLHVGISVEQGVVKGFVPQFLDGGGGQSGAENVSFDIENTDTVALEFDRVPFSRVSVMTPMNLGHFFFNLLLVKKKKF